MGPGPRDRAIARYVRRTVYPYSAHYRALLDAVGIGRHVRGRADLAPLPPTDLRRVPDPGALVLRPDFSAILHHGGPGLASWGAIAKVSGAMPAFSRHVERRFKPIIWALADGVPIGYSAEDAGRLARRGVGWLRRAGVTKDDVVVTVLPPGPSVAYWQLVLGCRRMGVSALHLGNEADAAALARFAPTVVVGDPVHLSTVLADGRRSGRAPQLRTVIAVGPPLGGDRRDRLRELTGAAPVVGAWSPAGVRAVWSECREGASAPVPAGYHAWPDDLLEPMGGDGELLWTGIGWAGTALLRLRTFAIAAAHSGPCPACGASVQLVVPHAPVAHPDDRGAPTAEHVLGRDPEVAAWLVEYRVVDGSAETIVTLAPSPGVDPEALVRRLDRQLRATQFVVLSAAEVAARANAAGGGPVLGAPAP